MEKITTLLAESAGIVSTLPDSENKKTLLKNLADIGKAAADLVTVPEAKANWQPLDRNNPPKA